MKDKRLILCGSITRTEDGFVVQLKTEDDPGGSGVARHQTEQCPTKLSALDLLSEWTRVFCLGHPKNSDTESYQVRMGKE